MTNFKTESREFSNYNLVETEYAVICCDSA